MGKEDTVSTLQAYTAAHERIEQDLKEHRQTIARLEKHKAQLEAMIQEHNLKKGEEGFPTGITEGAVALLRGEFKEGLTTKELAYHLQLRGTKSKSKKFQANVYSILKESNYYFVMGPDKKWRTVEPFVWRTPGRPMGTKIKKPNGSQASKGRKKKEH